MGMDGGNVVPGIHFLFFIPFPLVSKLALQLFTVLCFLVPFHFFIFPPKKVFSVKKAPGLPTELCHSYS